MVLYFLTFFSIFGQPGEDCFNNVIGDTLAFCSRLGMPQEYIVFLFGEPDLLIPRRDNWRQNGYLENHSLWAYSRFGVVLTFDGCRVQSMERYRTIIKGTGP